MNGATMEQTVGGRSVLFEDTSNIHHVVITHPVHLGYKRPVGYILLFKYMEVSLFPSSQICCETEVSATSH